MDFSSLNEEQIISFLSIYGLKIVGALAVFVIGRWVAKLLTKLMRAALTKAKVDKTLISFAGNIVYAALLTFVILAALEQLGVKTTSIVAVFAAAGLAVGLALQGSLSNFASGTMLISFRPFKIDDYVDIAGTSGTVREISIFNTTLKTPDNKTVIVPNGSITSNTITNYSTEATRRVDLTFGIGYDDDIKLAKDTLADILANDPRVLKTPAPVIAVSELGDSSVNFVVRPWVKTPDYWSFYFDTIESVKLTFDKKGISIPFPQRDVHIHQEKGKPTLKKAAPKKKPTKK